MRVIHITEAFGGGLRTAIVNYITATPQIDHTLLARIREAHVTTSIPPSARLEPYSGGLVGFYRRALGVVADGDYDIVHLHSSLAGVLRAVLPPSSRIVYSPHCYAMESDRVHPKTLAYWTAERVLAVRPQFLSAVSPREIELGHRLNKKMAARFVPNAVTPTVRPPSPAERTPSTRPTIAMLGRVCHQKAPRYFAEIATHTSDRYRYLWIGDGDEGRGSLEEAGVEITGWVTPDRARELLASADLYVHTAAWEGGPLATLEAADSGCPVICRDIPSMRSLGYELAGATPRATAAAIDRYFTEDVYRATVMSASTQLLRTYSIQRMSDELTSVYTAAAETLGSRPSRRTRRRTT